MRKKVVPRCARPLCEDGRIFYAGKGGGAAMMSRLMSMNPVGIALLLAGVAVMLLGKVIPERFRVPGKLAALALAVVGATLCFLH